MPKTWHIDNPQSCPMVVTVNVIGGKWKPIILHMLSTGILRHSELKRNIPPISQKVLTQQLRELEEDGVVVRTVYPEVPPKVDYGLTEKGQKLVPVLNALYEWGKDNRAIVS